MTSLYADFEAALLPILQPDTQLLVAFSGGLDSRVLLELAAQFAHIHFLPIKAVHVHHGLSVNADQWADFCQQQAQSLNVECTVERVQLDLEQGNSIEEVAREARYHALRQYIQPATLLMTGQHADDQIETFLLAAKRGSGPKGLSAMAHCAPFDVGQKVRPLLCHSRQQLEDYARSQKLSWVEDESNQDTRYDRNFLRQHIIPALTMRWSGLHKAVQRTSELCSEQEALLDELLAEPLQHALSADNSLSIEQLAKHSDLMRARLIRMWLSRLGQRMPSQHHIQLIWQQVALARQDANPQLQLDTGIIRRFAQRLYWVGKVDDVSEWQGTLSVGVPLTLPDGLGTLLLKPVPDDETDTELKGLPLMLPLPEVTVGFNPEGLSAHPERRGHSRKMKKLFQEYGVPSWLRRRMPILTANQEVVAVADLFVSRQFTGHSHELIWYE